MLRKILIYGIIAGLIVGIPMSVSTVAFNHHLPMVYSMAVGYLTMLIGLSAVFVAIKTHRDRDLGGVIRFWPALGLGLGVSLVAGVIYAFAWELTLHLTHMQFAESYADSYLAQQRAQGVSGEALAKVTAEMNKFKSDYANPFYRLFTAFLEPLPVSVLVSLVSAALLRNSRFLPARLKA